MTRAPFPSALCGFLLVTLCSPCAPAGDTDCGAPDTARGFGLVFDFQVAPNLSSLRAYRDGGYTVALGVGVNLSPRFLMMLNVYTGAQHIPQEPSKPAFGNLAVGGAAIEATYFLTEGHLLRPYAACGFGLYTDLVNEGPGGGYSGGGPHFEFGTELEWSRYFSLRVGAQYAAIYFHNPVGDADASPAFRAFTAHLLGGALRVSFYPSVLP